eukprot:1261229-Alexandrium_andersonii.AAC.1
MPMVGPPALVRPMHAPRTRPPHSLGPLTQGPPYPTERGALSAEDSARSCALASPNCQLRRTNTLGPTPHRPLGLASP